MYICHLVNHSLSILANMNCCTLILFLNLKMKIKIFIAMQPVKVEMIQDNYTTLQNTKQHELYYSHCHSVK